MTAQQPQILIVQSQPAAEAATAILGLPAHAAAGFDWATLAGRRVILWPTNTALSMAAFRANASTCWSHGAEQVKLITPGPLDPAGWDAAAARQDRWERQETLDWMRERAAPLDPPAPAAEPMPPAPPQAMLSAPDEPPVLDGPLEEQWAMLGLEVNKSGPVANEDTVLRCLERHPTLQGMVWYDEFLGRIMTHGPREWADADDVRLVSALQRELGISRAKVSHVKSAIIACAYANIRNSCKEWLMSLRWDKTERIHAFFPEAFGCEDTAYTRAVSRNFWLSLAARVLNPGCKLDNMVILEGSQGAGKSSALKAIASLNDGDGAFFTVQHESVTGKGFFEVLQGKMLVEIAEMDAFGKAEVTRVKQVVSTEVDRYREAYGRYAKDRPRSSIFVGTTNKDDWNRDETGARRFWPIRCVGRVDMAYIQRHRRQCFAEAVHGVLAKARYWEMPEEDTLAEQEARREEDPWCAAVEEWTNDPYRTSTTVRDALSGALSMKIADQGPVEIRRMGSVLRRIKWIKRHTAKGNVWFRPENEPS